MNGFDDRRRVSGFTLIELMIVIMIAAILLMIAFPDMMQMIQRNRIEAHTNDLTTSFGVARNAAIQRGEVSSVFGLEDGQSLTQGWRVGAASFSSPPPAPPMVLQSHEQVMRDAEFCGAACGDTLNDLPINDLKSISFNPRGGLDTVNEEFARSLSITLIPRNCVSGRKVGQTIEINAVGRVVTRQRACP